MGIINEKILILIFERRNIIGMLHKTLLLFTLKILKNVVCRGYLIYKMPNNIRNFLITDFLRDYIEVNNECK